MKNLFFFLFLASVNFFISCQTLTYKDFGIEEQLWIFANDIIENPDKIKDLKTNYPDLYNEDYIYKKLSNTSIETVYIDNLISYIKFDFANRGGSSQLKMSGFGSSNVDDYKKDIKYQGLKLEELFGFCIVKRGKGITYDFIKHGGKYYILYIGKFTVYSGNIPRYDD